MRTWNYSKEAEVWWVWTHARFANEPRHYLPPSYLDEALLSLESDIHEDIHERPWEKVFEYPYESYEEILDSLAQYGEAEGFAWRIIHDDKLTETDWEQINREASDIKFLSSQGLYPVPEPNEPQGSGDIEW